MVNESDWSVRVLDPNGEEREMLLADGSTLGRHPQSSIQLKDPRVSGRHACVVAHGGDLKVQDVGSSNKTIVEGGPTLEKGEEITLHDGMCFLIGDTRLWVRAPTEASPAPAAVPKAGELAGESQPDQAEASEAPVAAESEQPATPQVPQFKLHIEENGEARILEVPAGATIGRHPSSSCRLSDPHVSGRHACLVEYGGDVLWQEIGASERSQIEGGPTLERGEELPLHDGLVLLLGQSRISVSDMSRAPEAATEPAPAVEEREDPAQALARREEAIALSLSTAQGQAKERAVQSAAGFDALKSAQTGWKLNITPPEGEPRSYPLQSELTIGRHPENGVEISDPRASARHGRVFAAGGELLYEDLGSSNKSQVEDGPSLLEAECVALRPGVAVLVGDTRVEVVAD